MSRIITLDFETLPIEPMPNYPPQPIGVALKFGSEPGVYHSWGHASGTNTCTREKGLELLRDVVKQTYDGCRLVMHNAKFDWAVLKYVLGLNPNPGAVDCTMIQSFLHNPYEASLSLKPLSEKYLNWKPEERDAMGEWLMEHVRTPEGKKLSDAPKSDNYFVKYTYMAPPELAGPYAVGDVERTYQLYNLMSRYIETTNMGAAYRRELELMPILMQNEQTGIRVDLEHLSQDVANYTAYLAWVDDFIRAVLKRPELNIDSDRELVDALLSAGCVDAAKLKTTDNGQYSASYRNLAGALTDARWGGLLKYRSQIATCLSTFMTPWRDMAAANGGLMFTSWNQVRGIGGGARTGRFSSTPNFMNIPKLDDSLHLALNRDWYGMDDYARGFWPLPKMRGYIIPMHPGWCLLGRDYSQQELRIEAHFAGAPGPGLLLSKYLEDPMFDLHKFVQDELKYGHGIELDRRATKTVNFRIAYGGGARGVAEALDVPYNEGKAIRDAVLAANPDLKYLYEVTAQRDRLHEPIRTWGGRVYYTEPPKEIKGRMVNFAYKLVNYLIQGSAADCTKTAWVNLGANRDDCVTYFTVHDEFLLSCPAEALEEQMYRLKDSMEAVKFDLPMRSEGKFSFDNWGAMQPYDDERGLA